MPLSPDQEYELRKIELVNRADEISIQRLQLGQLASQSEEQLAQLERQRNTTIWVSLVSAILIFLAPIGNQLVGRAGGSPGKDYPVKSKEVDIATSQETDSAADDYALYIHDPFIGTETAGVYLFQPNSGRVWIARKQTDGKATWLQLPAPDNRASAVSSGAGSRSTIGAPVLATDAASGQAQ